METEQTEKTKGGAGAPEPAREADDPGVAGTGRRGRVSLYAVAFALMLAAGVILVVGTVGHLNSIKLLWVSASLSVAAIVVAVASVVAPRR